MNSEHELLVASSTSAEVNGGHFAELVQLEVLIEAASNSTNEYLTRSLMEKYSLLEHLRALKRFLLLGQVRMTMDHEFQRVNHSLWICAGRLHPVLDGPARSRAFKARC